MSCDVGKVAEGLENELWHRWNDGRVDVGEGASFSNPYIASPTSQLIFQPFRRLRLCLILQPLHHFTYVTAHFSTRPSLEDLPHFPTLTSLHLRHSSFFNPSVAWGSASFSNHYIASPTSQLIFQPFRRLRLCLILQPLHVFTYVTAHFNPSDAWPTSQLIPQPFVASLTS